MSFCKLHGSILDSSIWRESKETRLVWITMLAMKNRDGFVGASVPGLADRAKVSLEECVEALGALSRPDKWSRTKAHEGRRIEEVAGGWIVLNHAVYRDFSSDDEQRAYWRKKKAESRAKVLMKRGNPLPGEAIAERAFNRDGSDYSPHEFNGG